MDLYYARPEDQNLDTCRQLLSTEERARDQAFKHEGAQAQFVVGRAMLRTCLGARLGIPPRDLQLEVEEHGKLFLHSGPAFNLSHCQGMVVCVIDEDCHVGVDVESRERQPPLDIVDRFFAPAEVRALQALPSHQRPERFYAYWTLKESYIKGRGQGLSLGLSGFWFELAGGSPQICFAEDFEQGGCQWQFHRMRLSGEHVVAIARSAGAEQAPLEEALRLHAWEF